MADSIDRQDAIDLVRDVCDAILSECGCHYDSEVEDEVYDDIHEVSTILKCNKAIRKSLMDLLSAHPEQQWIPVKFRPMDSEEREYWEEQFGEELADEDAVMFDCQMPKDGQEILVSYRKWISMDKCEIDGGCYGLEGNGDWEGVVAWMPSPEPYRNET